MSSTALYQKYRSQTFDEVVGQEYTVRAIRNALKENKVGHAYLFCGPRGTGKTSMARLLARAVNCEHPENAPCNECASCRAAIEGTHPDIIEINAANETHVEDIRDLIDRARLSPMMGKHKIYIIDEVHQLSSSAASALLKTLEEPPEHVIFILATTDPQKLLKTIISRCQRFDFSKVDADKIRNHLLNIAKQEGFTLEDAAALKIAELADGGMRDSLSILEQARAYGDGVITEETIDSIFGLASAGERIAMLKDIFEGNLEGVLNRIASCESHGVDLRRLTDDLVTALKDGVIYQYTGNPDLLHSLSEDYAKEVSEKPASVLLSMIEVLMKASERYRTAQSVTTVFEIACLELMRKPEETTVTEEVKPKKTPAAKKEALPVKQETPVINEPARTEPEPVKEESSEETAKPEAKEDEADLLSAEEVLRLLVQCSKPEKQTAEDVLRRILSGVTMDRYSASLRQMDLMAAGSDVVLFTGSEAVVHLCAGVEMNRGIYACLKENGLDRMPYVVKTRTYEDAVKLFRERHRSGTLPEKRKVVRWKLKEALSKETETEQAVMDLFGKENVEVIEEGD